MTVGERVLVIGGTRGTGQLIVHLLEARGIAVRVLSRRAEDAIRDSGFDYTIIRCGVLLNTLEANARS